MNTHTHTRTQAMAYFEDNQTKQQTAKKKNRKRIYRNDVEVFRFDFACAFDIKLLLLIKA